ncbi:MAG: hypothetical protein JWO93_2998 [Micrococcaceae bacterium]|nr:hypothetical protein [Micrococcaceae bacterium]
MGSDNITPVATTAARPECVSSLLRTISLSIWAE